MRETPRERDDERAPALCDGPLVSVIVVVYNARSFLCALLAALARQTYPNFEVILFDNASTDGSADIVPTDMPGIRLLRSPVNLGYAGGNNAAVLSARGSYIAILNPDTEPEPEWLDALVSTLDADATIGLATSRIVLDTDHETINTCGNEVHVAGFATCRGLGMPVETHAVGADVAAISGAAFIIRRALWERLGGFDETFFIYVEDTDLSWRAWLLGMRCRYVPQSVVAHRYILAVGPEKIYYLERNRLQMLLKCYQFRTLLLLAPALILGECGAWIYACLRGPAHLHAKMRALRWILVQRGDILQRRREVQINRVVGDRILLDHATSRLPLALVRPGRLMRFIAGCTTVPFVLSRRLALIVEHVSGSSP